MTKQNEKQAIEEMARVIERSGDEFGEGDLYELAVEAEQILKGGAE